MKGEFQRKFHGIKVLRYSLELSHLLYVDDLLLYYRAKHEEAQNLLSLLNKYTSWSG